MATDLQGIPLAPLTGVLDTRSAPNSLPKGALRMRQNLRTTGEGKLRRGNGFAKLLSEAAYNNADFHDQLLTFTADSIRQPVTLITESTSTRGVRSLFLATQSRIAKLNAYSGNYRILGGGYGGTASTQGTARRFKSAQVGDYLVFTNDFDPPMYHELEGYVVDSPSMLKEFDDLATIGLSRAKVVWAWQNCLFFADVEMDQERIGCRLVWSNFRDPLGFDPAKPESITGYKDLFQHERILAGRPSGTSFLIYTTHGVWEMAVTGGEESFAFRRVYNGEDNENVGVLKYPNTLVSIPDSHVYMAEDGLYFFSQYSGRPERAEWLHRASSVLYDTLDTGNCEAHIAHFSANELLVSVSRTGATDALPDITLRVNLAYKVVDVVDHGFSAFANFRPFLAPSIRDFILLKEICTIDDLVTGGYGWSNEGLPLVVPASEAEFTPMSIYTSTPQTIGPLTPEDWNQASADSDSLCALLGDEHIDDTCRQCDGSSVLVAASSEDWCLKELTDVCHREICANPTAVGTSGAYGYTSSVGSYTLDGYDSILRFAPMFSGKHNVQCDEFRLDYLAVAQTPPSQIGLRVGISAQPVDPNVGGCGIVWHQHSLKDLKCLTARLEAAHLTANSQPSEYHAWDFYRVGRVLYLELKLSGTGGDALFTGVTAEVKVLETTNY